MTEVVEVLPAEDAALFGAIHADLMRIRERMVWLAVWHLSPLIDKYGINELVFEEIDRMELCPPDSTGVAHCTLRFAGRDVFYLYLEGLTWTLTETEHTTRLLSPWADVQWRVTP